MLDLTFINFFSKLDIGPYWNYDIWQQDILTAVLFFNQLSDGPGDPDH